MKKLSFVALLSIVCVALATAQPKSIGLRLGGNQEISFQQYLSDGERFIQVDLGSYYFQGLLGTVTYNWYSPSNNNPAFGIYYGFGAGFGFSWGDNDWYPKFWDKQDPNYESRMWNRSVNRRYWMAGVTGQFGVEYQFDDIPLAIGIDYRPMVGVEFGKKFYPNGNNPDVMQDPTSVLNGETSSYSKKMKVTYHTPGLWAFALNVRYTF